MFTSPVNSSNNSAQYNASANSNATTATIQPNLNRPGSPTNNPTTVSNVPTSSASSVIIGGNESATVGPVTSSSTSSNDMHHIQGHAYNHPYNTTSLPMHHLQQTPISHMTSSSNGIHYNPVAGSTVGGMPPVHNQMPAHHHSTHHMQPQSNQYIGHQYQQYHQDTIYGSNEYWPQVAGSTSTGYYDGQQVSPIKITRLGYLISIID
jgi:hypothetical protein